MKEIQLFNEEAEACILDIEMNYPQLYYLIEEMPFRTADSSLPNFCKGLEEYLNNLQERLLIFQTKFFVYQSKQKRLKSYLEMLFSETKEWIKDLEFYKKELNFFSDLISNRINNTTIIDLSHKEVYSNIDSLLFKLSQDVMLQIIRHKNQVDRLISADNILASFEENKTHYALLDKMNTIDSGIKKLKKSLFKYLKDHPFKFEFDTVIKEL